MPNIRLNLPDVEVFGGEFTDDYIRWETDKQDYKGNWGERGGSAEMRRDKWGSLDIRVSDFTPTGMTLTQAACGELRAHRWVRFIIDRRSWWIELKGGVDGDYECLTPAQATERREAAMDAADDAESGQ